MPTYTYACGACGDTKDKILSISQRDSLVGAPCDACTNGTLSRTITAPTVVSDGIRNGGLKVPDTFKDVLRDLKKNSGKHCTIDV